LSEPSRTLSEIRSDACNKILLMLSGLAVFGVTVIVARLLEQGATPVMGVYGVLLVLLTVVTLRRHRLNLTVRAATVTAIPFILGLTSVLVSGRLSGTLMFFVSSCVMAACFFARRIAYGMVALGVVTLLTIFVLFRTGIVTPHMIADSYSLSPVTWFSIAVSFVFAGAAPVAALSSVYRALDAERARANAAAEARTAFLANMSHELRTPMAGIIGMAEVLRDVDLKDQRQGAAANLILSSRNLMVVLNDLLDVAKFESGNIPVDRAPFRLAEMTGDLCAAFEARAQQKGLDFRIEFPHHFQDDLIGDGPRISQVLSNLIDNAVKFTNAGTVILTIDQTPHGEGLMLNCTVADTGIGIAADQHGEIFKPFTQGDTSISRKYGGSGLGLAICRALVDAMGGDIAVSSKPGHGAVFTIKVPLIAAAARAPATASRPAPPLGAPRPLKVLVAEDDVNMRVILEMKLPQMGYDATLVGDGVAALKAAAGGGYDCILMDMHMPIMDGPDAVRAIRAVEAARGGRRVPIIALTADLISERVRGFREAGVDEIAEKPVNWTAIAAQIQQLTTPATGK
jgi:signal transduction histidine kinase/ActR/RegA family two-component response regulator